MQCNQEQLKLSSDLCFTDYWGRKIKANGNILKCVILLWRVCGVFLPNRSMEESLEYCLQISLLMLYNCFVETGMRLLVVMEKSFHCLAKHNP